MNKAFTLVELAIVIVIIGLLVGGVLQGQELIRQAKIRNFLKGLEEYKAAVVVFKAQYHMMPGDYNKAVRMWGEANGGCPSGARTGTETCDGNGNGVLNINHEIYLAWQHLSNAKLIKGYYSGVPGPGEFRHSIPGENVPKFFDNAGFTFYYVSRQGTTCDPNWWCNRTYGHMVFFGRPQVDYLTYKPVFTGEEAFSMDTKIDDGNPANGSIKSWKGNSPISPYCADSDDENTAKYNLSRSGEVCSGMFSLGVD